MPLVQLKLLLRYLRIFLSLGGINMDLNNKHSAIKCNRSCIEYIILDIKSTFQHIQITSLQHLKIWHDQKLFPDVYPILVWLKLFHEQWQGQSHMDYSQLIMWLTSVSTNGVTHVADICVNPLSRYRRQCRPTRIYLQRCIC